MTDKTREDYREQAKNNVLKVFRTWDTPGFDACVEAEITKLSGIPYKPEQDIIDAHNRMMEFYNGK